MWPLSIIYLYQNCDLYLRVACVNYFSSRLRLVFEGDLYLKAASIRENTIIKVFKSLSQAQKAVSSAKLQTSVDSAR